MMSGTVPAVGNGHHYIPVETDAFEIVLRVFADEPVKHGVEVGAQFSAVCGILYQFFNLLVKLPLFRCSARRTLWQAMATDSPRSEQPVRYPLISTPSE